MRVRIRKGSIKSPPFMDLKTCGTKAGEMAERPVPVRAADIIRFPFAVQGGTLAGKESLAEDVAYYRIIPLFPKTRKEII